MQDDSKAMKTLLNIELSRAFLLKFLKFGVVGFSGVFVNFGVTYVCKEWLKWNKYLSNILGFIVAATTNYLLNRIWTFQSTNPQIGIEYVKYLDVPKHQPTNRDRIREVFWHRVGRLGHRHANGVAA